MLERCLYLAAVIAVAGAVTFALRFLPFLLFAGRNRALPPWVEKLGNVISPIIIAGLIAYSYSGLEWKTPWPYLAGLLTVGLQLWKRNALVSILAGTVVYMCLLSCGCMTADRIVFDAQNPSVRLSTTGVYFGGKRVEPMQVAEILEAHGVPHDRTIHILIDMDVAKDLSGARAMMWLLAKAGYTRPMLVTKRHAFSDIEENANGTSANPPPNGTAGKRVIRYKKASE